MLQIGAGRSYSRAQRYGSNARILGRAHVSILKAVFLGAIGESGSVAMIMYLRRRGVV